LTAAGKLPEGTKSRVAQAPARESPQAKEANRWLEMIEDRSREIRNQQIEEAVGRSRHVDKDW
jgi:hypothetical protein